MSTLLLLAVAAMAIPTIASAPGGPDRGHETEISVVVSVVLLVVFVASIPFSIGKRGTVAAAEESAVLPGRLWPLGLAVVVLTAAGRCLLPYARVVLTAIADAGRAVARVFAGPVFLQQRSGAVPGVPGPRPAPRPCTACTGGGAGLPAEPRGER